MMAENRGNAEPARSTCLLIVAGMAIAIVGLAYAFSLGLLLGFRQKPLELTCAVLGLLFVPPLGGLILFHLDGAKLQRSTTRALLAWTYTMAIVTIMLLAVLTILMHLLERDLEFWQTASQSAVVVLVVLHAAGSVVLRYPPFPTSSAIAERLALFVDDFRVLATFLCSLFFANALLFNVEPKNPFVNWVIALFVRSAAIEQPPNLFHAIAIACGILAVAVIVAFAERSAARRWQNKWPIVQRFVVATVVLLIWIHYFDFSLAIDALHYLSNVSPAIQVMPGGVPLVDGFSQYGPGPMLATLIGITIGPETFGSANITVQIFNLAFYSVILLCLTRLVNTKVAVAILGFAAIGVLFGVGNINAAPSMMGFRYIWPALMVLAISHLRVAQLHSIWTALATTGAAFWSIEALVGTLAIHLLFILASKACQRSFVPICSDFVLALAPAFVAVASFSLVIVIWSGSFPDFTAYSRFLMVYNAFSDYWGIPARGTFWGWAPIALTLAVVSMLVWARIFADPAPTSRTDQKLLYGYVPMASLMGLMSLYYLGRSVDFTLIIAFLPFSVVIIAAYVDGLAAWQQGGKLLRLALGLLSAGIILILTYSILALYGPNSAVRLAWHECRYHGHCMTHALLTELDQRVRNQPTLQADSNLGTSGRNLVFETVRLIALRLAHQERAAVFLGRAEANRSIATDLALFYAGKVHRWPISFTFTDELVPQLFERIVRAPIQLKEGEMVIVRRDESRLGPLESAILRQVRSQVLLCQEATDAVYVVLFRASYRETCDGI
jgi:hypothetical protein